MADGTLKEAQDLVVGDVLLSVELPGLGTNFSTESLLSWSASGDLGDVTLVETTIQSITTHPTDKLIVINNDGFSASHLILVKRGEDISMKYAAEIVETDLVWSYANQSWNAIEELNIIEYTHNVITINCEPYDVFFTEKTLTHDAMNYTLGQE